MVFRGKPSAGCKPCRVARKRCSLERPECARCQRMNLSCTGFGKPEDLRIQDDTEAVVRKAKKQNAVSRVPRDQRKHELTFVHASPAEHVSRPAVSRKDKDVSSSVNQIRLTQRGGTRDDPLPSPTSRACLQSSPIEISTQYFFKNFTIQGHWQSLRVIAGLPGSTSTVQNAIAACGMGALANTYFTPQGCEWARRHYCDALHQIKIDLGDPKRRLQNETLAAVLLLGQFENVTGEDATSVKSTKAHIAGACSLLKVRGTQQFESPVGRALFRELRAHVLVHCIWNDTKPPTFLMNWQPCLEAWTDIGEEAGPVDELAALCFDLADLRLQVRRGQLENDVAFRCNQDLDLRFSRWADSTMGHDAYTWTTVGAPISSHGWQNIHAYSPQRNGMALSAVCAWQTYRSLRILLSRMQEMLIRRLYGKSWKRSMLFRGVQAVRQKMADDICAAVPCALNKKPAVENRASTLVLASAQIWPLFFAGTVALDRIGISRSESWSLQDEQIGWVLEQLMYVSRSAGVRWAEGVAATLYGDFSVHEELRPDEEDICDVL